MAFTQHTAEELFLLTSEQLLDRMCVSLAGRAAEMIFFNRITPRSRVPNVIPVSIYIKDLLSLDRKEALDY